MNEQHWQNGIVVVVGTWLVISNWLLHYTISEPAPVALASMIFWNSVLSGAAAIVLGVMAIASFNLWEQWADIAIGAWLVISAWVLGFAHIPLAMWNVVLCGAIILLLAVWVIYDTREASRA